jgi:threonine dehydrogenase-like Zn-dependent dehydrogenase
MKALILNINIPRYLLIKSVGRFFPKSLPPFFSPLSLQEVPQPRLPGEDWVLVKTSMCGICGSDLNTILGRESPSLEPYGSFPVVTGHEAIGRIAELGKEVNGININQRVAVENVLPCKTRGIDPPCVFCQQGQYNLCENFDRGNIGAGVINGFNSGVGGGWGEYFPAHVSQLFPLPDQLPDEKAVLTDSLASALQAVASNPPADSDTVVVYGCGIIGIECVAIIRALFPNTKIIAVGRYPFQREAVVNAKANLVMSDKNLVNEVARATGARILKPSISQPFLEGGVDIVYDCVGSPNSIDKSMRILKGSGKLVLVATAGLVKKIDMTRVWFKELRLTGTSMFSHIDFEGRKMRTYQAAIELLNSGRIDVKGWLTHVFPIDQYRLALKTTLDKRKHKSIKVAFTFN